MHANISPHCSAKTYADWVQYSSQIWVLCLVFEKRSCIPGRQLRQWLKAWRVGCPWLICVIGQSFDTREIPPLASSVPGPFSLTCSSQFCALYLKEIRAHQRSLIPIHNSPIYNAYKTQSATVLARLWDRARIGWYPESGSLYCGLGLTWISLCVKTFADWVCHLSKVGELKLQI